MSIPGKIVKVGVRAALVVLSLMVVLLILINLPFVQDRLTGYAENYLKNKTGADITIEKISINFLGHILIREVFIPDQQQDTLLHLGKLEVGFQLRGLPRKKIRIKKVALDDVLVDLHPVQDSMMNYQFLIDAFSNPSEGGEEASREQEGGTSWDVLLPHSHLELNRVRFDYCLPDSSMVMDYSIGRFEASTKKVDLLTGQIGLDRLALEDSDIYIKMGPDSTEVPPDTATTPLNYAIEANELALTDVGYRMDMEDLLIDSYVGSAVATGNQVMLQADTMGIDIRQFDLSGSRYRMDTPSAPPAPGFDYSHLDLKDIQINIADFIYNNGGIFGAVEQIAGRDKCGFELSGFESRVAYTWDALELWELVAATPNTAMDMPHALVTFPFLEDSTLFEQMQLDIRLDSAVLAPEDIAYFVPQLEEQDFFRQHREEPLRLSATLTGTLADLAIPKFELRGWDAYAGLSGRLQHVTDVDRLVTDLDIHAIESSGSGIRKWMPPDALPKNVELPNDILLRGSLSGPLRRLNVDLEATTSRTAQPIAARLQVEGRLDNIMEPDRLGYDLTVDTLWAGRREMEAYLPDSFPAYIELPEAVGLAGVFKGTMDSLFTDLHLLALRDSLASEIRIAGTVDSFTTTDALAYDLKLNELIVQPGEIAAYLPDSTLPAYLRIPVIEHGEGAFRGDLANIDAKYRLDLSDGTIEADARLEDSAYVANIALKDLVLQELFQDSLAFDTVVGWPAPPMALEVVADGRGLDVERDLRANASLRLRFLGDTIHWKEGLVLKGTIDRKSFRGNLTVHEREVDLNLEALADYNPGQDTIAVTGGLNLLDLQALRLSEVPFTIKSKLGLMARGRSLDSLFANLVAGDFNIEYNGVREATDLLVAGLIRDTAQNALAAIFLSDFLEVKIADQTNNPELFAAGLPELEKKLGISSDKLQLNQDSTKNLFASLQVIRPGIFTSGIIPGLTELEPIEALAALDMQDSSFAIYGDIPHVKYRGFQFDSTEIAAVNWDNFFLGLLAINRAYLLDSIEVADLTFSGTQIRPDTIIFRVSQLDTTLAPDPQHMPLRFFVNAQVARNKNSYSVKFFEKPIINFDTLWRVDPTNEAIWENGDLQIHHLTLSKGNQSLSIDEVAADLLRLEFDNFDLEFFSDILKWKSHYAMGVADGNVEVLNPLESPEIKTDLRVAEFGVMDSRLGDLTLQAANDTSGTWNAGLELNGEGNAVTLNGTYQPTPDSVRIEGKLLAQPLNLATLDSLTKDYVEDMAGGLNMDLTIAGSSSHPAVEGEVSFVDVVLRPVMTGSRLEIPGGNVSFSGQSIVTPGPLIIKDSLGSEAQLVLAAGTDYNAYFVTGSLNSENFLLLNTTEKDNSLYYGRLFSDVDLQVSGYLDDVLRLNGKLTPRQNSTFYYIYDQGDELEEIDTGDGYVTFVDFDLIDSIEQELSEEQKDTVRRRASGLDLNISADLNKNLDLTVVMDREAGDRLEGKAEGNIAFRYPPSGEPELSGQIDVSGSKYFYTYQKVIKKDFELQDGSTIVFTGPVDDADINLKAGYTAKTPPFTLVSVYGGIDENSSMEVLNRLRQRQEFLVTIQAKGTLEAAELIADITYPRTLGNSSTDLVDPALSQLRANSTEMNTQAFSLILFNSFRLSDGAQAGKSIINLKQELGDILAGQLNNLANQYINFAEVNFDIETLSTDATTFDFENIDFRINLRKRFINDRLVVEIDGLATTSQIRKNEYGQEYTEQNMQAFLENVSVEYSLTKKGALKIRVFNQYDFDDFIGSNVIKLGGTLVLSKDFNRIIFRKNHQPANPNPPRPRIVIEEPADSLGGKTEEPRDSIINDR